MQKGFSLVELLIVSLLGSLLLLAASQGLATLAKHQKDQSELLRLTERSNLAEVALKKAIYEAQNIFIAGEATSNYPDFTEKNTLLGYPKTSKVSFNQFTSSDWMLLSQGKSVEKRYLFHLDKKTYGYGLAFQDFGKNTPRSDTLVNQVELVRFKFFCEEAQAWIRGNQVSSCKKVTGASFALLLASSQALEKKQSAQVILWGEKLTLPTDGIYRQLVSATVHLMDKPL